MHTDLNIIIGRYQRIMYVDSKMISNSYINATDATPYFNLLNVKERRTPLKGLKQRHHSRRHCDVRSPFNVFP